MKTLIKKLTEEELNHVVGGAIEKSYMPDFKSFLNKDLLNKLFALYTGCLKKTNEGAFK
jgi:bacteriocin-like protein